MELSDPRKGPPDSDPTVKIYKKAKAVWKWLVDQLIGPINNSPENYCVDYSALVECEELAAQKEVMEPAHKAVGVLSKRKKGKTRIVNSWKNIFKKFFQNRHRNRNQKHRHQNKHKQSPRTLPENAFVTHDMVVPAHNVINARSIGGDTMDQSTQTPISLYLICGLIFMFVFAAILNWCFGKKRSLDPVEVERRRLLDAENAWLNYEEDQEEWNVEGVPEGLGSLTN